MPRHKSDEWISGNEATDILSKNSGREITSAYLRLIARQGKIRMRAVDGRTNEYYRPDVEGYKVRPRSRAEREAMEKAAKDAA
jgi:hypothetical protein